MDQKDQSQKDQRTPDDFPNAVHASLNQLRHIAQIARCRNDTRLRRATPEEIALSEAQRRPVDCTAHSGRTGLACRGRAVIGCGVCIKHGAQYAHVKAARDRRLQELAGPALTEMYKMAMDPEHSRVKVQAAADILDRAGVGAVVESRVRASFRGVIGTGVTVQIGFLQTMTPDRVISGEASDGQGLLPAAGVIDAEVAEPAGGSEARVAAAPAAGDERDPA